MLAVRYDDERDASGVPQRHRCILRKARVKPRQILPTHLQNVDQPHPSLEAVQVGNPIWDQPRANIGIEAYNPSAGLTPQQPFQRGSHRLEHESDRSKVQSRSRRQRR
jgi:hypothetical protein